eukprot:6186132-Pleurochrysis_carterae.AAC.1
MNLSFSEQFFSDREVGRRDVDAAASVAAHHGGGMGAKRAVDADGQGRQLAHTLAGLIWCCLPQDQPELHFHKLKDGELDSKDAPPRLVLDTSATHQTIAGFGGAFTQAAAQNYMSLSEDDRAELMHLYFGKPEDGGHGYTMGRVPINSCDFAPFSYNFDNKTDDKELKHFDDSVKQDVDNGMVPMIKAAQAKIKERDMELSLLASPWSPPGWMKLPGPEGVKSMVTSAKPNGLDPDYQRPWAKYMSRWIDAYKAHGIGVWGVTVQNEPEATAGWESMLYTPSFMASFVKEHLGPVLKVGSIETRDVASHSMNAVRWISPCIKAIRYDFSQD